jgi:hypothetical protein
MSRHSNHSEIRAQFRQCDVVAVRQRVGDDLGGFECRAEYWNRVAGNEFGNAADMIAVPVGDENRAQLVAGRRQELHYRRGLARVDDGDPAPLSDGPDIVIFKRFDRFDKHGGRL